MSAVVVTSEEARQRARIKAARQRMGFDAQSVPDGLVQIKMERRLASLEHMIERLLTRLDAIDPPASALSEREMDAVSTARRIVREVSDKHGISVIELMSRRQYQRIVRARHEAFWRMRQETTLSYPQIGRVVGGFDHTTVLVGCRRHMQRMAAQ